MPLDFDKTFKALTGMTEPEEGPFPWQQALYRDWFSQGKIPASCNLPTGLGKTSVIAVWLIALANGCAVPQRLVYVVNRRTVVDQTTNEVEKYRDNSAVLGLPDKLAISTLRGQFADNREWSADPSRPAVICGTVDMIGSRLLFSGYGCGFKTRPLHAGFLGQDALIVHDEAHLEPAFQDLLVAIAKEQARCKDFCPLRVMELTATSRAGTEKPFELTDEEKNPPAEIPEPPAEPIHHAWRRLKAKKGLRFVPEKRDEIAKRIGQLARDRKPTGSAVLVFVRTIDDVKSVQDVLTDKKNGGVEKDQVQTLTGTLRGLERDRLAREDEVFARFLPKPNVVPKSGAVYLVCTSAGEVGVDISADHMVCDLTTLDSMAQRFGRVNRRGAGAAEIDVVFETGTETKPKSPEFEAARWKAKELLERLPPCDWIADRKEASPLCLRELKSTDDERKAAFAPPPVILPTSDILFDAWALTTIRDRLPGRPHVEPYLHGIRTWEPPETHVAWREEVWELPLLYKGATERWQLNSSERKQLAKLAEKSLEDYPLKPHELLRDRSDRVFKHLTTIAARHPDAHAWLVDDEGGVEIVAITDLADKDEKDRINRRTVILPPEVGGLHEGLLDGSATETTGLDVADEWFADKEHKVHRRLRVWGDARDTDPRLKDMRQIQRIDFPPGDDEDAEGRTWYWFERPRSADDDGSKTAAAEPIYWKHHTRDVTRNTERIVSALKLGDGLQKAFVLAAKFHDLGKQRAVWQRSIGNPNPKGPPWFAKSGRDWKTHEITDYRHEFGSVVEVTSDKELDNHPHRDLILHLIAAHHGRGRPHFPTDEAFDPESKGDAASAVAREVPQRFAKLQRKYGRWGLAYLESLLRAADYAASANPSKFEPEDGS